MRDLVLLLVGGVAGYYLALQGRGRRIVSSLPDASDIPHRFQHYYRNHPNEVIIGAVMLAIIFYLASGKKGGGTVKRK